MRFPSVRSLLLAGVALIAGAAPATAQPMAHRFHADHVLGTSLDVTVNADPAAARRAAEAARAEILRLDAILSGWRDDSDLARLNRGVAAEAPAELAEAIGLAEHWRATTGGAFDGRLGEVTAARRAGDLTRAARAVAAVRSAEPPAMARTGVLQSEGPAFDLDGVAKGYVIDRALAAAQAAAPEARGMMVELGGDLRCAGTAPNGAWTVGCADGSTLALSDGALATSGAGERDLVDTGGRPTSHLVRPWDGQAAAYRAAATVHAPCAADADALATALCVMPAADGIALAERLPGVEARLTDAWGAVHTTSGWSRLARPAPRLTRAALLSAWPADAQVTLAYEVPRIEAPKYYAPYIAIWITDADGSLVKTLSLLGQKPRYLESNYVWWRRYGRKQDNVDAMTKPTRAPGRYTAVWDGSTDAGPKAAPGRYSVHVEAARQDGGHTYETLEITVGAGGANAAAAAPKDELGSLKVTVGRAGHAA